MKSVPIHLFIVISIFTSYSTTLAAATAGNPGAFGREELNPGEIILLLGIVIIFIAIKSFMSSAWGSQDKKNKDDRP